MKQGVKQTIKEIGRSSATAAERDLDERMS